MKNYHQGLFAYKLVRPDFCVYMGRAAGRLPCVLPVWEKFYPKADAQQILIAVWASFSHLCQQPRHCTVTNGYLSDIVR
jgi:hypothetical protein